MALLHPEPLPQQVRIRTEHAAAKHGTEMAPTRAMPCLAACSTPSTSSSNPPRRAPPATPWAGQHGGVVEEVGRSDGPPGDRVCAYSGFADVVVTAAERCWKMPPGMDWRSAVCLDPAEFAFNAVRDGHVRIGDAVAVFGLGAIGLMAVQLAQLAGAAVVVAIDPLAERREIAAALGADLTLDPTAVDAGPRSSAPPPSGAPTSSSSTAARCTPCRRRCGRGLMAARWWRAPFHPMAPALDLGAEAHLNLPTIVFTRACSQPDRDHPRWDESRIFETCWRWLCDGRLTGAPIVTPVVAYDDLADEYPKIAQHPERYIKLGARI